MAPRLRPRHLERLVTLGAPTLSPDASRAVTIRVDIVPGDGEAPPRYRRRLLLVDLDTGHARPLGTFERLREVRWSPCGRYLAFLATPRVQPSDASRGDGTAQLHVLPVDGGEAWAVSGFPAGVEAFVWEADGAHLLLTSREGWRDESSRRGAGRWIEQRVQRFDGVGWVPRGPLSLWRVARDEGGTAKRRWGLAQTPSELALSGDGTHLLYLAPADDREADDGLTRLWSRRLRGRAEPKDLLGRAGRLGNLSPSPDGTLVAFQAPSDLTTLGAPATTFVVPRRGGSVRALSDDLETAPSTIGDTRAAATTRPRWWGPETLLIAANREGRSHLHTLGFDGTLTALEAGDQTVVSFDGAHGWAVSVRETPVSPGVLVVRDPSGSERVLCDPNGAFLARRGVVRHERRRFTSEDGQELTYWHLRPAKPRRDGALVVQVHGGPYANYGEAFVLEFQLLAAAGFSVVYGNPRGGSSFGAAFAGAIKGAYGSVDADDVMAITDHALAHHDVDGAPVHLTGGSYGGFMTNWLTAHTDRFRSAVTQRSICNWLSFYGTADIGPWFGGEEQGGNPWDDTARLWERSPLAHVANVRTPTLVIHSELDHRCPIEQAEQWFTALKELGVETRLLRFPDEGHDLSRSGRPDRRIERLEAIIGWFEQHA